MRSRTLRSALAGVAIATTLLLAACSSSTPEAAPTPDVTSPALTGADLTGTVPISIVGCCRDTFFAPAIATWNGENPDKPAAQEVIPFADLNSTLQSRLSSQDSSFDTYVLDTPRTAAYVASGQLVDITDTYGPTADGVVNPVSLEGVTVAGRLYAAPVFNSTQVLVYNKDLLSKAGVAAPSIDPAKRTTWEQLESDAQKVQAATGTQAGLILNQANSYFQMQELIMSAGGGTGLTGDGNLTPDVTDAGWTKALGFLSDVYKKGIAPTGVPVLQQSQIFLAGQSPYIVTNSANVGDYAKAGMNFGVAAFPEFAGGTAVTACDSFALAINPYSKHQAQAMDFIKWLTTTREGALAVTSASTNLVANQTMAAELTKKVETTSPSDITGFADLVAYETQNTCQHRPSSIGYVAFETDVTESLANIINGSDPVAEQASLQTRLVTDLSRL